MRQEQYALYAAKQEQPDSWRYYAIQKLTEIDRDVFEKEMFDDLRFF